MAMLAVWSCLPLFFLRRGGFARYSLPIGFVFGRAVLPIGRFRSWADAIARVFPLAWVVWVVVSCLQACHLYGRRFGGVHFPAELRAPPRKPFSRLGVFSASHAV